MKDYQCCGSKYIEFESGSAFGIRIRILKDPEYGSNTDVYFPSKLIFKRSKVTITIHRSSVLDPGFFPRIRISLFVRIRIGQKSGSVKKTS